MGDRTDSGKLPSANLGRFLKTAAVHLLKSSQSGSFPILNFELLMPPRGKSRLTHQAAETKLFALLVAVNQYEDRRFGNLSYSLQDCQELEQALKVATKELINPCRMIVHHDREKTNLPRKKQVLDSLEKLIAAADDKTTILFYFCGHGLLADNSKKQPILCLQDTRTDDLENTGIDLQKLFDRIGNSQAKRQIIWIDACHSGAMTFREEKVETRGQSPASQSRITSEVIGRIKKPKLREGKYFYAMLSCDKNQQSFAFPELEHGVFTYYLIRGLRGKAADESGIIEADNLYRYVFHETLRYIDRTNQHNRKLNEQKRSRSEGGEEYKEYPLQTPKRLVEGIGDFILGFSPIEDWGPSLRRALVIDGSIARAPTLELCEILRSKGGFAVEYRSEREDWRRVKNSGGKFSAPGQRNRTGLLAG